MQFSSLDLALLALPHLDPRDIVRSEVAGKLLVPKDGKSLLESELEPVPAGDPISGPVVEVLVPNNSLDPLVVPIAGSLLVCKDVCGVENVEALVLHGSHVEVVNRDNVVDVEVVLEAELRSVKR